jgi:hypothetical protein
MRAAIFVIFSNNDVTVGNTYPRDINLLKIVITETRTRFWVKYPTLIVFYWLIRIRNHQTYII